MQPVVKKEPGQLKLVSVALISAMKNILLVLEALGKSSGLSDANGESLFAGTIEYNIYGPVKDKQYWHACAALIKSMPANVKVNYHGDIAPAKIVGALAANHVFVLQRLGGVSIYQRAPTCLISINGVDHSNYYINKH